MNIKSAKLFTLFFPHVNKTQATRYTKKVAKLRDEWKETVWIQLILDSFTLICKPNSQKTAVLYRMYRIKKENILHEVGGLQPGSVCLTD